MAAGCGYKIMYKLHGTDASGVDSNYAICARSRGHLQAHQLLLKACFPVLIPP